MIRLGLVRLGYVRYDCLSEIDSLKYIMVVNQWIIIRVSHNTMDVIHGYQLTYCSYSWLSKIPWMLIMVNHGSYSFIVVSGGTPHGYSCPAEVFG